MKTLKKICISIVFILMIYELYNVYYFIEKEDSLDYKSRKNASIRIEQAVQVFLLESDCYDLSDLYDYNRNKIIIKQNDQESVENLILALLNPIYYKGKVFGPYIKDTDFIRYAIGKKKCLSYRIEITKDGYVNCFPVRKKSEVSIVFLQYNKS